MYALRMIVTGLVMAIAAPTQVQAQSQQSGLEQQIVAQGYEVIYSQTTWLGRLRILAVRGDLMREIVVGPGTGEVLRDVVYDIPGLSAQVADARTGSGGGREVDFDPLDGAAALTAGPPEPMVGGAIVEPTVDTRTLDMSDPDGLVTTTDE